MKRPLFKYLAFAAVILLPLQAQAQEEAPSSRAPGVTARLIPDSVAIGDRVTLRVEIDKDIMQIVGFPENLELGEDFVVISEQPEDTLRGDGRRHTLTKEYILTCFREGIYDIGRFPSLYADKNIVDTIWSEEILRLMVTVPRVDTVMTTIYDIKAPEKAPLLVSEFSGYLLWSIIGLCFAAAVIYFIFRSASRRRDKDGPEITKPREAAHVRAIRDLEALHNLKLWQSNKHKLYYSHLTDILRTYIEGRYGIGAPEMTTEEIMDALKGEGLPQKSYNDLRAILYTSDLVKFAKHVPDGDGNEKVWYDACAFVEDTKEVPDADNQPEENNNDKPVGGTRDEQ